MTKLFEDIKEGLEEAIAYSEGKDTGAYVLPDTSNCIETENKRIEEQNNPRFWLSVETDSRKVYAHKLTKAKYRNEMVKITYTQALEERKNGTEFSPQALEKLGVK